MQRSINLIYTYPMSVVYPLRGIAVYGGLVVYLKILL